MNIDWGALPFGYHKTDFNVRCYYKDGKWGSLEVSSSETIDMHIAATALHYGQQAFEGLKVYRGKDGNARLFRWQENVKRMTRSAEGIMMAKVPEELFKEAIFKVIELNSKYIPPYGTGATFYLRPLLFGSGPQVGVKPAEEYAFMVFGTPVGPYFKQGFRPVPIEVIRDYDRAAPQGTGSIKVGGNYAASMLPADRAHEDGFASVLFLDALEKKYIDEAGPANFYGIKDKRYITPCSDSILPSITNMSLEQIAEDIGLKVERRKVPVEELDTFEEVGACGTAAIISPISKVYDRVKNITYDYGNIPGPYTTKLYITLRGIQEGALEDRYNWTTVIEGV